MKELPLALQIQQKNNLLKLCEKTSKKPKKEEEEPNERSRSEPPKQRPKFPRESPTSRPLGLRPRVAGYPEIRFDSVGTWALIASAPPAPVTTLVGAKSSRRVNPSPKPGVEPKLTRSQWSSGPNTQFYHLDEEESEGTSSEELIPASDEHVQLQRPSIGAA